MQLVIFFFFNLFIYAPFLKSSLGFFAQFWRLFVRLEFLVFNRLYWATIACFCCAAREETSFPSCFGGPIKKCNIATICELLQNKVQFLLQRKQSHRPPIELRQLCYPPVGSVPMLPPEKAHVIDVTCLRWPVGLKWPHSTHLCREQMVQMWWLSNNPLILVCFCCWQKKKMSYCSSREAVKVFVKHCKALRFFYVDASFSWWISMCTHSRAVYGPLICDILAVLLSSWEGFSALQLKACRHAYRHLVNSIKKQREKMSHWTFFVHFLNSQFLHRQPLFRFWAPRMWLYSVQIMQVIWRHAADAWYTWNEPECLRLNDLLKMRTRWHLNLHCFELCPCELYSLSARVCNVTDDASEHKKSRRIQGICVHSTAPSVSYENCQRLRTSVRSATRTVVSPKKEENWAPRLEHPTSLPFFQKALVELMWG